MVARILGKPGRRIGLATVSLLLVLLVGLFWRILFCAETFADRDLAAYYRAAKALVAPLARASQGIPLWNPFFASGQPFAANPEHEVFHPLTTLFFLLPFELAFRLQVILPLLAGVASMYFLLRTLRRSRVASLFGGLGWGFGGYLLSTTNLLPILFAASILPLSLTFVVRLVRRPRKADVAALALCVGVQCLAGEPSTLLATPLLCAAAALAGWRRHARFGSPAAVAGLVLGLAVGAITLLPGVHHARKTVRNLGLASSEAGQWSMPPVRALDLLAPGVLGHVVPGDETLYWGRSLYPKRESPYFFSLYPGLAVTLLAFAAWRYRRRTLLPWIVVAAFGYLLSLGEHFALWRLARHLPIVSGVRFPEKYALLFILPLIVASAYGYDQVIMGPHKSRQRLARVLVGLAAIATLGAAGVALAAKSFSADFPWRVVAGDALRVAEVAAALLIVLWPRIRCGRTTRALLVCAVLALDLVTAGRAIVHTTPLKVLAGPPASFAPLLNRASDDLIFHAAEWHPTMGQVEGTGRPPLPAQWGLPMTLERDFDLTFLRWTDEGTHAFWTAVRAHPSLTTPLLQRRGVTAVVQFRQGAHWQDGFVVGPAGQGPVEVVFLQGPQPIVFAASHVEIVHGGEGWLAAVGRLQGQVRDSVCVDDEGLASFPMQPSPAEVQVYSRTPESIVMNVEAQGPSPSFVAFNQTWDEGWRLTLDGKPASLLRTDVSLSGFVVPPGKHRMVLEYGDPWLDAGAIISIVAALGCLALVLSGRRRGQGGSRRLDETGQVLGG
jgi:Predicted membrane protein